MSGSSVDAARRHDLDWLRVFATYLLFVFHVAMVFSPAPFYHIRNADLSVAMMIVAGFISLWHMPLFFLLAGWSIHASLQQRGPGAFAKERLLRLGVPLVMGCVLLIPPIKYLELRGGLDLNHIGLRVAPALQDGFKLVIPEGLAVAPPFEQSFREFLPTFFTQLDRFSWAHLWFVAYLFTFTLLYLPVFSWLRRGRDRFRTAGVAWIYAPAVLLAVIQVTLRPRWPGIQNLYNDWANFAYYSTYLTAGFLLACYPHLEDALRSEWKRALAVGVGTALVLLCAALGVLRSPLILLAGSAVAGWCFVVALLGAAHTFLMRTHRVLPYLTESAFPVYVLHQSAIVLIGYGLIQMPLGIALKYVLLLLASLSVTLATYHFAVRPFAATRFLFGLKSKAGVPLRRMRAAHASTVLMVAIVLAVAVSPATAASPIGIWYAEGGAAQVEIRPCGDELCGHVVWLRSPFDENGCDWRDRFNRSIALRNQPVVGLEILRGMRQSSSETRLWHGGTVYDPASGNVYRATLRVEDDDRLQVRGYVGIPLLGRSTTWIRVGSEARLCAQVPRTDSGVSQ